MRIGCWRYFVPPLSCVVTDLREQSFLRSLWPYSKQLHSVKVSGCVAIKVYCQLQMVVYTDDDLVSIRIFPK